MNIPPANFQFPLLGSLFGEFEHTNPPSIFQFPLLGSLLILWLLEDMPLLVLSIPFIGFNDGYERWVTFRSPDEFLSIPFIGFDS